MIRYLILCAAIGGQALAATKTDFSRDPAFRRRVEKLASQYDQRWQLSQRARSMQPLHDLCDDEPAGPTCLDAVCGLIGQFNCDEASEVRSVGEACRGNRGGECVNKACSYVGRFECDDPPEALRMARACRGVWRPACIDEVCGRLGRLECDDPGEILAVLDSCR